MREFFAALRMTTFRSCGEVQRALAEAARKTLSEWLRDETAETGSEESEGERFLHGLLAAGGALVQPDLNYPWVMSRLWWKRLRKTLRRYYSFPFWNAV